MRQILKEPQHTGHALQQFLRMPLHGDHFAVGAFRGLRDAVCCPGCDAQIRRAGFDALMVHGVGIDLGDTQDPGQATVGKDSDLMDS